MRRGSKLRAIPILLFGETKSILCVTLDCTCTCCQFCARIIYISNHLTLGNTVQCTELITLYFNILREKSDILTILLLPKNLNGTIFKTIVYYDSHMRMPTTSIYSVSTLLCVRVIVSSSLIYKLDPDEQLDSIASIGTIDAQLPVEVDFMPKFAKICHRIKTIDSWTVQCCAELLTHPVFKTNVDNLPGTVEL